MAKANHKSNDKCLSHMLLGMCIHASYDAYLGYDATQYDMKK